MTPTSTAPPYDLADALAATETVEIPAGTSLLVSGRTDLGRSVVLDALADGGRYDEGALVITTDASARDVRDAYTDRAASDEDLLRIIDCQAGHTGLDRSATTLVQDVDTPRNLTDLGIGFSNALDAFESLGIERARVGLLSLSVVLSYVDQETTYRFCQTLTRRLDQESYLGLFAIDAGAHDDRTLKTLRRAFDGVLRVRAAEGDGVAFRIEGLDGVDDAWRGDTA